MVPARKSLLLTSAVLLFTAACSGAKGKAEAAITAADQAITAIGADAANVIPGDVQALTAKVAAARDTLAKGDAAAALAAVADIPAKAQELAGGLAAKRTQLKAELDTLGAAMTKNLAAVQAKVTELAKTRKLPKGLTAAKLDSVKATLAGATSDWSAVMADIGSGKLAEAMGKGTVLRLKVSEAMVAVGLTADEVAWHNVTLPPQ